MAGGGLGGLRLFYIAALRPGGSRAGFVAPGTTPPPPPPCTLQGPEAANFTAGSPLAVGGPEVPGFRRYLGTGLFGQQGYTCPGTTQ